MESGIKATVTYDCRERGHEMKCTITAHIQGGTMDVKCEFEPDVSDDTSDPTGLLEYTINAMQHLTRRMGIEPE